MSDTSAAYFERIARDTLDALPEPFDRLARGLVLRVVDWPPQHFLDEFGMEDPYELTGLYDGVPLTEKSTADQVTQPDMIWLFREPILDEWRDRGNVSLQELVSHVTIHELAHHFGWSDDDIAQIDRWWE